MAQRIASPRLPKRLPPARTPSARTPARRSPRSPVRFVSPTGQTAAPEIDALVQQIIGRVADKWTLLVLEVLDQHGTLRFTQLGKLVGRVSQKMLTKTLRDMERDGFVTRTVFPVIPPRVEYALTPLGLSLGHAFCSVWTWAEQHHAELTAARQLYRERATAPQP